MSYQLKRSKRIDCFDEGIPIDKLFKTADVTWVYGSTEEERQKYIDTLIDENMREYVSHVYRITKSANIKGEFAEDETKILVVHNLKAANIGEQDICRLIDGGSFDLGYRDWNGVHIFPEKVYISSDKLPEQVYARSEFKERVIRRVARTIKLD